MATFTYRFNEKEYPVNVKERISMDEENTLVEYVVQHSFGDTGKYSAILRDVYTWITILTMYTDFNMNDFDGPQREAIIDDGEMPVNLIRAINTAQFDRIMNEIDRRIDEKLNVNPLADVLIALKNIIADGAESARKLMNDEAFVNAVKEIAKDDGKMSKLADVIQGAVVSK